MGCGSSQLVPQNREEEPNHQANGHVKKAVTPPPQNHSAQPREQEPQADPPRKKTPEPAQPRSPSSQSSSSSSSSDSSKSSKSGARPETAPGQEGDGDKEKVKEKEKAKEKEQEQELEQEQEQEKEAEKEIIEIEQASEQTVEPNNNNETDKPDGPPPETQATEETEKPNFSEDVLKGFVDLENEIRELEKTDPENTYKAKHSTLTEMYQTYKNQNEKLEQLKLQTHKEYQDVVQIANPTVRAMFATQMQHDALVAKEQQEYVDALNRQEVAQDELDTTKHQYQKLYQEVGQALKDTQALYDKRLKQEELLGKIFNDCYGSDQEWKLELELDMAAERKERIRTANYKWTNAQTFLSAAASQVIWACRRWEQISTLTSANTMVKYQMVAETRNHLIAASQNISTGIGFMSPIKTPYWSEDDLKNLNNAIGTIFNDVNVPTMYQKAYNQYYGIYKKIDRLTEWARMVIKDTIKKDLAEIKLQYHEKYFELKQERYNLIQAKVKEALGIEIELDIKKEDAPPEDKDESAAEESAVATPTVVEAEEGEEKAPEAQETGELPEAPQVTTCEQPEAPAEGGEAAAPEGGEGGEGEEAGAEVPSVAAVSATVAAAATLSELAPPPSQDDLFGDIEQLKKKHEEELAEFEKTQNMNRARVEQGLQEKLRARRSRKRKVQVQEAEAQMLTDAPPPAEAL